MAHSISIPASQKIPVYVNRRLRLTVSTAACLWGFYSAYALFFSPLFAPRIESVGERKDALQTADSKRLTEERRQAEQYLRGQPWAAEPKKGYHFRTETGFFYFKNWDNQVDDGRKVRFQPFAMIWRPKGHDPAKPPFTIVSESAVVEFTSKFEVSNPNPGRVIGGALEGDVQIRGADGLAIDGQQFYFGEQVQRVWSDHAIKFQHGQHRGKATGVELDLVSHPNPDKAETLAITGVRTVRLRKAVEMWLTPAGGTPDKPVEPVHIESQGAFEYEVLNYIAKFEKKVRVRQPTGGGQVDRLHCETLTLVFERDDGNKAAGAPVDPAAPKAGQNGFESKLKFCRLLAVDNVIVSSQRSDMQGWMTSLNYDEQARRIALSDARHVRLLQKNNELLCPEITADLDEEKKQVETVECRGSGQLYQYARGTDQNAPASKKTPELSATWQRKLTKAPDAATGLDLIELEGRAELKRIGEMSLEADVIGIWVTRGNGRLGRSNEGDPGDNGEDAIQPKKLLALKEVKFSSPQIGGQTESLAVWFEEGKLPPVPLVEARRVSQLTRRPVPGLDAADAEPVDEAISGAPRRQLIVRGQSPSTARKSPQQGSLRSGSVAPAGQQGLATIDDSPAGSRSTQPPTRRGPAAKPVTAGPPGPATTKARGSATKVAQKPREPAGELPADKTPARPPAKPRDKPLAVVAELIQVRAMRDGDKTEIAEVVTEGRVHVQQEHASGELPLDVTGDKLLLWNYGETNQVLQVYGKPAQVQDRKMQLEGPDIRFDRIANKALVTGAGVLRVPVPNGMDGKPLAEPKLLDVFWKEKMDFDGKTARFYANVHSQLDGSDMRCEEMRVTFNRRVSFADDDAGDQNTEIESVVCRDGVDLKSFEYEGTRLVSVRTARGFEFKLNQATGRVTSQGPGTLELWRRDGGKQPAQRPGVKGNQGGRVDSTGWEYTRIDFDGTMAGSTKKQETTFRDVKRVVYGSVANSTDTIDEDNIPKDGGYMKCDELTLTQVPETNKEKAYMMMKAVGNTRLDGRSFHALAQSVTFDESKDQYILTGDGKRDATIWRETKPGAPRSGQSAQKMRFIPSKNELSFDRVSGGQLER